MVKCNQLTPLLFKKFKRRVPWHTNAARCHQFYATKLNNAK